MTRRSRSLALAISLAIALAATAGCTRFIDLTRGQDGGPSGKPDSSFLPDANKLDDGSFSFDGGKDPLPDAFPSDASLPD